MSTVIKTFSGRVTKVSELIKKPELEISKCLKDIGIEDNDLAIPLLEAETTTNQIIVESLGPLEIPSVILNVAVRILKTGVSPLEKKASDYVESPVMSAINDQAEGRIVSSVAEAIKGAFAANRSLSNYSDSELVEAYAESGSGELEPELIKRSNGNRFLVVPYEGNKTLNKIDVAASIRALKKARRNESFPAEYQDENGKLHRIFSVMEFSPEGRVLEVSPLYPEIVLFDGYCEASGLNFNGISDECRAFLKLIKDYLTSKNEALTTSEARNLLTIARAKGLSGLRGQYPQVSPQYDELELVGNLPRLRKMKEPSSRDHNRKTVEHYFGNKKEY